MLNVFKIKRETGAFCVCVCVCVCVCACVRAPACMRASACVHVCSVFHILCIPISLCLFITVCYVLIFLKTKSFSSRRILTCKVMSQMSPGSPTSMMTSQVKHAREAAAGRLISSRGIIKVYLSIYKKSLHWLKHK